VFELNFAFNPSAFTILSAWIRVSGFATNVDGVTHETSVTRLQNRRLYQTQPPGGLKGGGDRRGQRGRKKGSAFHLQMLSPYGSGSEIAHGDAGRRTARST
jgi:hypothetical protein